MPEEEKLFYTIGEAAQILNVKPYVLRYWETEVKKLNPQKSETGQRTYRKKDLQVALTLKRLLYDEKYTIAGAIIKLDELEKEGLDQLDMFGNKPNEITRTIKTPDPEPISPKVHETDPGSQVSGQEIITPPPKPAFSKEKLTELRNLTASTYSILKKHNLA